MSKVNIGKMPPSACQELSGFINEESNCMVDDSKSTENMKKPKGVKLR